MKISIIICTYNRSDILKDVLENLCKLDSVEESEIIIVNNNSTDRTIELIEGFLKKYPNLNIINIFEYTQGLSFARNRGIKESNGDIIAFLDDDAFPHNQWLNAIKNFFALHQDVVAVGGKVLGRFEIDKPVWITSEVEMAYSLLNLGDEEIEFIEGFPIGVNFAVRRVALENLKFSTELGRKKDSLLSGEETELMRSLKKTGKIYYLPNMLVEHFIHKERLEKEWLIRRNYAGGQTEIKMNKELKKRIKLLFRSFIRKLGRRYRYIFSCDEQKKFILKYKMAYDQGIIDEFLRKRFCK